MNMCFHIIILIKILNDNFLNGSIILSSSGNVLNNTNQLKSNITNDIVYYGSDFISKNGFKNNITIDVKFKFFRKKYIRI